MSQNLNTITYEVEYLLIGSLLKSQLNSKARDVLSWLEPEMFATFQLGAIYEAIRKQALKDNVIDMLLLNADYGQDFATLGEIMKNTISWANLDGYAEKVRQYHQRREAQKIFLGVASELQNARDEQLDSITSTGLTHLSKLLKRGGKVKPFNMPDLVDGYMELFQERAKPSFKERLLFTGIEALDEKLGGINDTDICIVAGRAGNGKTETAITFTKNIIANKGSVLFFSLEMSKEQIMDRLIASASGVNSVKLRNPEMMNDEDFGKMGMALKPLQNQKLFIVDKSGLTADEIVGIAENHIQEQGKVSAVIIDYIGLVRHGALDGRVNRTYQIGESMERFKTFCKNNHVPMILLAQLNRNADGSRPSNADLRDSGSLEQDASQIIMVHNQRNKDGEPAPYTEWIVTKNRFGSNGTVYMQFKQGQFIECDQAMAWEYFQQPKESKTSTSKRYGAMQ
ncbi:replicative DNA helicase [Mannheimia bovis]|uniref:DNA 5'-3' helicase n=1 Tax=Mannheimia bovis TaxID=2770636 RepID=A0A7H1C0N9_9PAST|nr:replicative DNA helicase [Mannheimia bovis]QNS14544.1 DNA helicase [Mannheimia bovis]